MFVIFDENPFRVVEGAGFKMLCKQLQPNLNIPSRRTIAKKCYKIYQMRKLG